MPAKNSRKQYYEKGYYHLYNRGVEKRKIFLDDQDYSVFLSYLNDYLVPKDYPTLLERLNDKSVSSKERAKILKLLRLNNFAEEISLLAYCLMPNHFHLFVKQEKVRSIDKFMNSLGTRYTMFFNKKYNRVGSLYQGVYKAVPITKESQFIYLSKYIHEQALNYQPSSYEDYLGKKQTQWVNPHEVLTYFSKNQPNLSYQSFVESLPNEDKTQELSEIELED